jgi:hypothetical protein
MSASLHKGLTWQDKTLLADEIYAQLQSLLGTQNIELPTTPRRPDVRMILNNVSGATQRFYNPGNHSGDHMEEIKGAGDKTAAMMMLKGDTLEEQYANAEKLYQEFNLGAKGLSPELLKSLSRPAVYTKMDEMYGPAPFKEQSEKLVPLNWLNNNGSESVIKPVFGEACSFGVRPATKETVFLAKVPIYMKGTGTVPELLEADGICIAVSKHWETGEISTRPIVPSVAKGYYGAHFDSMPVVTIHPEHGVSMVNLRNGTDPIRHTQYKPQPKGVAATAAARPV